MARYIDANAFQEKLAEVAREPDYRHEGEDWRCGVCLAGTHLDGFPTADVVPRRKFAKRLLLDLKAAVTNKATYPDFNADYAYVNLKVFNALVQDLVKKYEEGKDEG